jgi:uncharacterized protein
MTMSTESNKQVIERYFAAVNRGDEAAILECLSDDFVFLSMLRHPEWLRYRWGREQFAATQRFMSSQMKKPIVLNALDITAENDRVCVEAESFGEMKNGKVYDNAYHFVFKLKNGKISECREYSCSFTANYVFGDFQQGFDSL